jgi:hypothetical protein
MSGRSRGGQSARAFQAKAQWCALVAADRLCEGASCLTGRCTRRAPRKVAAGSLEDLRSRGARG